MAGDSGKGTDLLSNLLKGNTSLPPISQNALPGSPISSSTSLPPIQSYPLKPTGFPLKIIPPAPKNETELASRIRTDTQSILKTKLELIQARHVPTPPEVANNEAKIITTAVLHVDMRRSSQILETFDAATALRIYKIFHATLVAVARYKKGRIRTFAGDRIGVVFDFYTQSPRSIAVVTAILMEEMLETIVNPILSSSIGYTIEYGIGVDYGQMLVGKIGLSGTDNNNLAWVGKAMNTASKLADIQKPGIYITDDVHQHMDSSLKDPSTMMWEMPFQHPEHGLIHKWIMKL